MTVRSNESGATPEPPVFMRRSTLADVSELERLAAGGGTLRPPSGFYLIAEIRGQIVAAVSLDRTERVLRDPAHETANVEELLCRWGRKLRREARRLDRQAA